ncbi:MAG: hypothetical protein KC621_04735 [Myxococcales bacterium]|nr:hypothetical protein [Myxococcales bacterium]
MDTNDPKLPRVPASVGRVALATMCAQFGLTFLMFFCPPWLAGVLFAVGLLASVAVGAWNGAALRRAGGGFELDAVRTHALAALGVFSAVGTSNLLFGLNAAFAKTSGSLGESIGSLGFFFLSLLAFSVYVLLSTWWLFSSKPAAVAAYGAWLARRDDPRMVRWRSIRRRAEGSPRTEALADRSIEALERLLFDRPDPLELVELDAAADRLEATLREGPHLAARLDDAEDEIRAIREVERLGRGARSRET